MRILIFSLSTVAILGVLQLLFLRFFHKAWWKIKLIRRVVWFIPVAGLLGMGLWMLGEYTNNDWVSYIGSITTVITVMSELFLIISLPLSGLFRLSNFTLDRLQKEQPQESKIDYKRRQLLNGITAGIPLLALSSGVAGVLCAQGSTKVYLKQIKLSALPSELKGLRILHLSDLHLRHYLTLDNLEEILLKAKQFNPDLTVVAGDIADDLSLLHEAMKLIHQLNPPMGTFASLGNHEHYRGIKTVRQIFDKSEVPLLIDQVETITHKNKTISLGGIDDPRRMGAKESNFFRGAIDKIMPDISPDNFSILMSHRPDAFDYASETGINLVLAGHTHGGQIGFRGRSLYENYWPDRYLWGEYHREKTTLYTSAGAGHWFPFRLGCPAEAPIIELT